MKEFYPLDHWQIIEKELLDPRSLGESPLSKELSAEEMRSLCVEVNQVLSKASGKIQEGSHWLPVRESITHQHRVEILVTPNGLSRGIALKANMSLSECGLEEKLIGKSVQTVPFAVSFIVNKVGPKHPLFQFGGKQMSCKVSIQNVFKPPFKTPTLPVCENGEAFRASLLETLRSMPFHLSESFAKELRDHKATHAEGKETLRSMADFLHDFSGIPNTFKKIILDQIKDLGAIFDPELELSYTETVYRVFEKSKHQYSPPSFQANIESLFFSRFEQVMEQVVNQITQQQKDVRQRLTNFSEIESERQRLIALAQDLEAQKKKGVGDEILRRHRQDLNKLAQRIHKKIRQYESSKGIILIQELYISALEKAEHYKSALKKIDAEMKQLKSLLQANHISASRDIETLTQSLGVHAHHLLIQHAIYSEVEPDLTQVVALENVGKYELKDIELALNLLPTVKASLQGKTIDSNSLLQVFVQGDVPESEKATFVRYCEEHPDPKNPQVHRFNQQAEQFIHVSRGGKGIDGIVAFLNKELFVLKAVVRFAAEQNKLSTDFRNHLRYYDKLFMEPYLHIIESAKHSEHDDIDRTYGKILNSIKTQMDIRYSNIEEKALLCIFKQINSQLQNDNLFAANVFTKQVKNMMSQLSRYKDKIPQTLMKKILETYTIYMMGSSRTKNLSQGQSGLSKDELERIRNDRTTLTT